MKAAEPGASPTPARPEKPPNNDAEIPESDAFAHAEAVADAVLFEGYLLYPYRRSSVKNRTRWQFGVLAPRNWIEAQGPQRPTISGSADSWRQQTECLFEGPLTGRVRLKLRFLQLQHRSVQAADPADGFVEVDALQIGADRHLTFDEAVSQDFVRELDLADLADRPYLGGFALPGGETIEPLGDGQGRIVRRRWPLSATVRLTLTEVDAPFPLRKLHLVVENTISGVTADLPRPQVLRHSLIAAHSLLGLDTGAFLSATSPPTWATEAAKGCVNRSTFPVLGGPEDSRAVVLSAPIILYDHPRIAPESPGDLFDATEIDEILSLRTLTLTDEEKREARATDPRAAAILDRVDTLPPEVLSRLHGAVRSLRPLPRTDPDADTAPVATTATRPDPDRAAAAHGDAHADPPDDAQLRANTDPHARATPSPAPPTVAAWWDPEADAAVSPDTDEVVIDGVPVRRGSRVRLRPRPNGTDVHDMFLDGRTARVEAVFLDVDGARHIAVIVEDDPGADLHRWYGRFHYFAPEEIEPVRESAS